MRLLLVHGPNLNRLGTRDPDLYGTVTLDGIVQATAERARELDVEVVPFQSNHEGAIVDKIQQAMGRIAGLIGAGAKELIFTGRRVDAAEALDIGLANKICEPSELLAECRNMAAMICETGPIAIEQAKYAINYGLETDLQTGLAIESNA